MTTMEIRRKLESLFNEDPKSYGVALAIIVLADEVDDLRIEMEGVGASIANAIKEEKQ